MTILTVVNNGDLILCNVITTFMTFATLDQISLKVGVNKAREFHTHSHKPDLLFLVVSLKKYNFTILIFKFVDIDYAYDDQR